MSFIGSSQIVRVLEGVSHFALKANGFASRRKSTRFGEVHYYEKRVKNEKGVLVFIHGVGANAGHYGRILGPLHNEGYSVISVDLLGHGKSSDPGRLLTAETLFQGFVDWIRQVQTDRFVLIGNSLGGALSLRFALEFPRSLEKLVMVSPAGGFEDAEEWEEFKKGLQFRSIEDSKLYLHKIYHQDPIFLPLFYSFFFEVMSRDGIQGMIKNCEFKEFERMRHEGALNQLPPSLLIWGQSERVFPTQHLNRFRSLLPSHVLFDRPAQIGHCPQVENPEWFWKRIDTFIQSGQ